MRLTILGNNGPFPSAGGACSGYLIEDSEHKLLLDCGNGVLANLQKYTSFEDLDAIILTHLHSDHISDMMVLKYAVQIKRKRGVIKNPVNVFATSEPLEEYKRLDVKDAFNLKPVTKSTVLNFGSIKVTFSEMTHPAKCHAVSIDNGNKRFVFSGDTSWNESIIEFCRGADMAMLDAGLLQKDKTDENVPHLTAKECGIIAREAEVKRLMLTHFWPDYDIRDLLNEAREGFQCVEAAVLLETYEI